MADCTHTEREERTDWAEVKGVWVPTTTYSACVECRQVVGIRTRTAAFMSDGTPRRVGEWRRVATATEPRP